MRIGLLSVLDTRGDGAGARPAFAKFAGAMLVERQLDLAIELGCERIICIVDAVGSEVVELQHRAERGGVKFRPIRRPSRLLGMVTAEDELVVVAPGLLPEDEAVTTALKGPGVLSLPAAIAVPLGYERIDLELAWAGLMIVRGELVARLGQLPDDVDIPSALLRLALQSGTQIVPLDENLLAEGRWHLDPDRNALDIREKRWIDAQRKAISFRGPGLAVAERAGARLARDVVGQPAQPVPTIAAGLSVLGAIGAGALGHADIGIVLTGLAALFGHMAGVVDRIARFGRPKRRSNPILKVLDWLIDPLLIGLIIVASPESLGWLRAFVPLMLLGLLRLGERHASREWRETYADRIMLAFLVAPAAFGGYAAHAAAAIALLVLATRFFPAFRDD